MTGALDISLTIDQVRQVSPAALAYVGDGIYELWVRLHFLMPKKQMGAYHQAVVECVRAENQAHLLALLSPLLTEEELSIVKRGRNSAVRVPKRLSHSVYQQATGFEALIGYLYLTDSERLAEVFNQLASLLMNSTNSSS